jgi:hypothetical protein
MGFNSAFKGLSGQIWLWFIFRIPCFLRWAELSQVLWALGHPNSSAVVMNGVLLPHLCVCMVWCLTRFTAWCFLYVPPDVKSTDPHSAHTVYLYAHYGFDVHGSVHRDKFLIIKPTRCTNFWNLFLEWNSTCFGQFLCPSSGVFTVHTAMVYVIGVCRHLSSRITMELSSILTYTIAVCTVKNSWWWTEELPETCGVSFQEKFWEISASSWFYYKKFIGMELSSCSQAVSKPVWHILLLCTVKNFWWWTEELSETCSFIRRINFRNLFIWLIILYEMLTMVFRAVSVSLYDTSLLVFITDECVYCSVRSGYI